MKPIDARVHASKYQLLLMVGFVLLVGILGVASHLRVWQWAAFAVMVAILAYWQLGQNRLLHLVSDDELWECLIDTYKNEQIWQVDVHTLVDFGWCVMLKGWVVEPMQQSVRFVIFADMMDEDMYRRLKVMARF